MDASRRHNLSRAAFLPLVIGTTLLFACTLSRSPDQAALITLSGITDPAVLITSELVDGHIRYLSSDELKGRDAFSEDIRIAEDYIAEKFQAAGLSAFAEFVGFRDEFAHESRSRRDPEATPVTYELANIVGFVEGTDPVLKNEYILFGAHHDHLGVRGEAEDNIYNGADDNAAGTTAVIALAEYFGTTHNNKRSIIFATFTGEEKGLIGARHLAGNLPIDPTQFVCMINFEMIGKPAEDGSYNLMVLGPSYSTLDEIFAGAIDDDSPITLVGPEEHQVRYFNGSDNRAFHSEGYITTTLASPRSTDDPYYHQPNDHYEYLNIDYMTDVIRAVVDITETLVSGEETPVKTGEGGSG
jgi:hypothetical protein